jgi:hypothetical protein
MARLLDKVIDCSPLSLFEEAISPSLSRLSSWIAAVILPLASPNVAVNVCGHCPSRPIKA